MICEQHFPRGLYLAVVAGMFFILTTPLHGITVHPGHYELNREYGSQPHFACSGWVVGQHPDGGLYHQGGVQVIGPHHVITTFHGTAGSTVDWEGYLIGFGVNLVDALPDALTVVEVISHPQAAVGGKDYVIMRVEEDLSDKIAPLFVGSIEVNTEFGTVDPHR